MLKRIHIQNYALIKSLDLELGDGFMAITGETGSGKSILLGALGLVLGERADTQVLFDKKAKCIVEAEFSLNGLDLANLFKAHDLDHLPQSIFRREINPAGRSRAFINDSPVSIAILKEVSETLVDIHSQHQTLLLNEESFQLDVLDLFAQHGKSLIDYQNIFKAYKAKQQEIDALKAFNAKHSIDEDYLQFQLKELEEVELIPGEDERLAEELGLLKNAGEIKSTLVQSSAYLNDESGLLDQLNSLSHKIDGIAMHTKGLDELSNRLESVRLELDDIAQTIEHVESQVDLDPERQEIVEEQLDGFNRLFTKHRVNSVDSLIELKKEIDEKLLIASESALRQHHLEAELHALESKVKTLAEQLTKARKTAISLFTKEVESHFKALSLPHGKVDVMISQSPDYHLYGVDDVIILFNANKGGRLEPLSKVASGGELSRLMLILKRQFAKSKQLPTLIFDEIDTGVSGEIASQMAAMLRDMSQGRQVIAITHLPQVAARANHHLKISKSDTDKRSITEVTALDEDGRVLELAKMLSGTTVSQASVANAKELLKN